MFNQLKLFSAQVFRASLRISNQIRRFPFSKREISVMTGVEIAAFAVAAAMVLSIVFKGW